MIAISYKILEEFHKLTYVLVILTILFVVREKYFIVQEDGFLETILLELIKATHPVHLGNDIEQPSVPEIQLVESLHIL